MLAAERAQVGVAMYRGMDDRCNAHAATINVERPRKLGEAARDAAELLREKRIGREVNLDHTASVRRRRRVYSVS